MLIGPITHVMWGEKYRRGNRRGKCYTTIRTRILNLFCLEANFSDRRPDLSGKILILKDPLLFFIFTLPDLKPSHVIWKWTPISVFYVLHSFGIRESVLFIQIYWHSSTVLMSRTGSPFTNDCRKIEKGSLHACQFQMSLF